MRNLLMVLPALMMISCGSKEIILRPDGTRANIYFTNGTSETVELLALQGDVLLCAVDTIREIPLARIESLRLDIDQSNGWIPAVLVLEALPSAIFLATDIQEIGVAGIAITGFTWICFEVSGPRVRFDQPWDREDVEALQLHMKYPQGLTGEQLAYLRTLFIKRTP